MNVVYNIRCEHKDIGLRSQNLYVYVYVWYLRFDSGSYVNFGFLAEWYSVIKMSTGSVFVLFTNVVYMLILLFIIQCIVLCVGGQEDNIVYSARSQPQFSFRQQGTARSTSFWTALYSRVDVFMLNTPGSAGRGKMRMWHWVKCWCQCGGPYWTGVTVGSYIPGTY